MPQVMIIIISGDAQEIQQQPHEDPYEKLWDAAETAAYLNTDDNTVYELARLGKLPSIQLSERRVRFDPPVIRQWVKNGGKTEAGLKLVRG